MKRMLPSGFWCAPELKLWMPTASNGFYARCPECREVSFHKNLGGGNKCGSCGNIAFFWWESPPETVKCSASESISEAFDRQEKE